MVRLLEGVRAEVLRFLTDATCMERAAPDWESIRAWIQILTARDELSAEEAADLVALLQRIPVLRPAARQHTVIDVNTARGIEYRPTDHSGRIRNGRQAPFGSSSHAA